MIRIEDVLELHKKSIIDFGGSHGIRDQGLLESAIARPFQTFGGEYLYQTAIVEWLNENSVAAGKKL